MDSLRKLYNDSQGMQDLKNIFQVVINEEAVTRVMNREDVSGIADAKEIVDAVFSRLDDMFAPEVKVNKDNQAL